jgi:secreted PhoX family phosphatase
MTDRISNDKGSTRKRRERSSEPDIRQLLELRLGRREFTAASLVATALPATLLAAGCDTRGDRETETRVDFDLTFEEVAFHDRREDVLPPGYSRNILIHWGDPLSAGAPEFDASRQTTAAALQQFGYNNDFLAFLPFESGSSDRGLLAVNHEYPIPWLMWDDVSEDDVAAMTREQVDVSLAAVGLSVVEVRQEDGAWRYVRDSRYNRRISMFTPIDIRGPARGHERMRTADDPAGTTVLGTHDNCNGGVTPWGTVLSGEEGSADFFAGDNRKSPDHDHLQRYYYEEQSDTGDYGWPLYHPRLNFENEMNEPNRFEWIVEVDPFEPDRAPVKRTALGRFAHEGAHTVLNSDGRVVVFMGDDWEFEYVYRFVSDGTYDDQDRDANRNLLDNGELAVARFDEDGTLEWRPIRFGEGPLTAENGFSDQGDVLIQTRRAADMLGATPMDAPEGFVSDPRTGVLYLALTQNRDRRTEQTSAANPRANNEYGHVLELHTPAGSGGAHDYSARHFDWLVMLLCGPPNDAAPFHPDTEVHSQFTDPDNLSVDPFGRLWVCTDDGNGARDALYVMQTSGPGRKLSKRFYLPALEAECCSPAFTPDGRTLFLAVQHPGEEASRLADSVTNWPAKKAGTPPRPSVIAITRDDGGIIGS